MAEENEKVLKAKALAGVEEIEKVVRSYWEKYGQPADADLIELNIEHLKKGLSETKGRVMDDKEELQQIQKALEGFIGKRGGQYICTVIWPDSPAKKDEIPMGASHVRIMNSKPYVQAVDALVTGEAMFSKK